MTLYKLAVILVRPIAKLIFPYRVINRKGVPTDKGFILASKHLSYIDPVFLALCCHGQKVHYMAKSELFHNKAFGWLIRHLGAFPVKRGAGDTQSINFAIKLAKENKIMAMFPEGTRVPYGKPTRARSGVGLIAYKSGADVLPVLIKPHTKDGKVKAFHFTEIFIGELIRNEDFEFTDGSVEEIKAASAKVMNSILTAEDGAYMEAGMDDEEKVLNGEE